MRIVIFSEQLHNLGIFGTTLAQWMVTLKIGGNDYWINAMLDNGPPNVETISFGPFRLHVAERRLERAGAPVHLSGRALDVLVRLVERAGLVVSSGRR